MTKRRPNALDRDIAHYVRHLPEGKHIVEVERSEKNVWRRAPIKAEGGLILYENDIRITFIPAQAPTDWKENQ